jgi:ribosomal protein S24E
MELKITKQEQNPLFNRKEIEAVITSEKAPSNEEVAKKLAEKLSAEPGSLRILGIKGKFGSREFTVRANIYSSKEERDSTEQLTKKEKAQEAKVSEKSEPEEAEKPKEAPAEEKPAEAAPAPEKPAEETKTPAEETIGLNPVEEAKKAEAEKAKEDKKEKEKTEEEKQLENPK